MRSPGQLENANLKEEGALVDPNSPPTPVEPPRCQPRPDAPSRAGWPGREPRSEADGQQGAPLAQGVAQHCQVPRLAPGQGAERQRLGQGQGACQASRGQELRGEVAMLKEGQEALGGRWLAMQAGWCHAQHQELGQLREEKKRHRKLQEQMNAAIRLTVERWVRCATTWPAWRRGWPTAPTREPGTCGVFPMVSSPGSMGRGWAARPGPRAPCPMAGVLIHGPGPQTACPKRWSPRSPWAVEHSWEVLDAFHTCLSQLEAQQQAAQLEKQDRSGAPQCHLHGQLVNLAVATILLVCISAAWACGLPLLRSRRRALSTLGVLALLSLAGHCWEGTCW
ncbi:unnamed protein product [Lepidochelys kempii]